MIFELIFFPQYSGSTGILDKPVMQVLVEELVLKNLKLDELFKAKKFSYIVVRNLLFDAAKFRNAEFINKLNLHLSSYRMDNRRFPSKFISHCCYTWARECLQSNI